MSDVPAWMAPATFEYLLQFTEAHEGQTNFMYNNWPIKNPSKDVTVGVGIAVTSENHAASDDIRRLFRVKATGAPAASDEMRREFRRVYDLPRTPGNLFSDYRDKSPLEIPSSIMRESLRRKMLEFWDARGSSDRFPDFSSIPAQAQVALMSWNYGLRLRGAPKMCQAVKNGDYATAANESQISGWDGQKNEAHKRLLLNAGAIVQQGLNFGLLPPLGTFKPPPAVAGAPAPAPRGDMNWLFGWWSVWDGNQYYYHFSAGGKVIYVETWQTAASPPPAAPRNRGVYSWTPAGELKIVWNEAGGASTIETFYDASRRASDMHANSNRYSPLYAKKLN